MPNLVAPIVNRIQQEHPGASVHERKASELIMRLAANRYVTVSALGSLLHYRDGLGQWQEIDTDWRDSDDAAFSDRADRAAFKVYSKDDGTRRLYPRREVAGEYVEFGIPEYWQTTGGGRWRALPVGVKNRALERLTFDGTNVAIALLSTPTALKMDVTLKTSAAPTRLRWPVTLVGLTLGADWLLRSIASGVVVGSLPAPLMNDANLVERAVSVTYAGGYVEYSADTSGLAFPIEIDPTVDTQVAAGADDGQEDGDGDVNATTATMSVLGDIAISRFGLLRFASVTIGAGATINSAYISVMFANSGTDSPNGTLYGEDSATPAQVSGGTDTYGISGRTRTTASTSWVAANVGSGSFVNSPSIVGIIQELNASYDYSSGAALAIVAVGGTGGSESGTINSYETTGNVSGAKLYIDWTEGGGATSAHLPRRLALLGVGR